MLLSPKCRLLLLPVLTALFAAAPTRPPAPVPMLVRLAEGAEGRWVPFRMTPGNQIQFTVVIDGHPATAILDTGVTRSAIARSFAARQGLTISDIGQVGAIGGDVAMGWAPIRRLTIGGLERTGGSMAVIDLPANATGGTLPVDALIGQDMISRYAIDIDYQASRFRLIPSGRLPFSGVSAPLAKTEGLDLYVTETSMGGKRQRPMMIDTGDGASITYSSESWTAAGANTPAPTNIIAYGLAGKLISDLTIMPSLAVGDLQVRDVEVRIEPAGGYSRSIGVAGRLGNGLLSRYRVLLDAQAGHIVFAATPLTDVEPVRSTSGVQVGWEGTRLRVIHVMRASPAATAGWRDDDMICSIDGVGINDSYPSSALANWTIGTPGRNVAIGMCDGQQRRLQLRNFY